MAKESDLLKPHQECPYDRSDFYGGYLAMLWDEAVARGCQDPQAEVEQMMKERIAKGDKSRFKRRWRKRS